MLKFLIPSVKNCFPKGQTHAAPHFPLHPGSPIYLTPPWAKPALSLLKSFLGANVAVCCFNLHFFDYYVGWSFPHVLRSLHFIFLSCLFTLLCLFFYPVSGHGLLICLSSLKKKDISPFPSYIKGLILCIFWPLHSIVSLSYFLIPLLHVHTPSCISLSTGF